LGNTPQISEILGIDRSVFYLLEIPDAQFNLGVMYETGQGVEQSYEKAVEYFTMAAAQ
jgi:TPR repeat protein